MNKQRSKKTIQIETATDNQKEEVISYAIATSERIAPLINADQKEIVLTGEEAASLVITIKVLYYELGKVVSAHNKMVDNLDVVSAHVTHGMAENTEQASRIGKAIEAVLASGNLADLHKGWALDQILRILTGCQGAEDSEGYQQATTRYYSATDEQWDRGMEP